jgi:sugar/nucleoside kinase (ribokinase family)
MATHLGAAIEYKAEYLVEEALQSTAVLHIEGYQLDSLNQTEAITRAMRLVKESGGRVSLDLADSYLIQRHRTVLESLLDEYVDIIFCNETEAKELTGKEPREALDEIAARCEVAVVTLGKDGSLIKGGDEVHQIPSVPVQVVNTNGAGDTFGGAFLQSFLAGRSLEEAGRIAAYLAAQVVASEGSRVEREYGEEILGLVGGEDS